MWLSLISVFVGSGLGGVLRFLTAFFMQSSSFGSSRWTLPWTTLIVNIAGCFLFGLIYGFALQSLINKEFKLALTTGFCGGLTTFSTFSYEILEMFGSGRIWSGIAYAAISLGAGVAAAWCGYALTR